MTSLILYLQSTLQSVQAAEEANYAYAPLPARQQLLDNLAAQEYDILVVGGGATGCGVALDSVSRGKRSAVIFFTFLGTVRTSSIGKNSVVFSSIWE